MRSERPVGILILAFLHIGIGTLALAALVLWVSLSVAEEGLHLFDLLALIVFFVLGPGIGMGFLWGYKWSWYTATVLYLLTAAAGGFGLWALATATPPPGQEELLTSLEAARILSLGVFTVYVLVALALYAFLFITRIRSHFELYKGRWWVLGAEVVGVVALAVLIGVSAVRAERARTASVEASKNLPIIQQIGERGTAVTDADVEFLLARLESIDAEERLNAAWALGRGGRPEAVEPLTALARDDDDSNVRINAIASLAELGGSSVGPVLVELLDDPDLQVQQGALRGLADEAYREYAPEIGRLLRHDQPEVRSMAVDVLGNLDDPGLVDTLAHAADDPEADIRSRVAFAMGKLGNAAAAGTLEKLLEDPSWEVRANAAQALGMVGARDSRSALQRAAGDPNSYVRDAARAALGRLR